MSPETTVSGSSISGIASSGIRGACLWPPVDHRRIGGSDIGYRYRRSAKIR
jgi:hypothetical protein